MKRVLKIPFSSINASHKDKEFLPEKRFSRYIQTSVGKFTALSVSVGKFLPYTQWRNRRRLGLGQPLTAPKLLGIKGVPKKFSRDKPSCTFQGEHKMGPLILLTS